MSHRSDRHEQEAVFWCSLLQPLILEEVPREEAATFLRQLAEQEQLFPDGQRKKPSLATLWRKWKLVREGGFEALLRRRRSDRGKPRSVEQEVIDKAVELKKDQPRRSEETINRFLEHEFQTTVPKSTLYRHLKRAGATRLKLGIAKQKVRCRWTRDQSNALWVGDFEKEPRHYMSNPSLPFRAEADSNRTAGAANASRVAAAASGRSRSRRSFMPSPKDGQFPPRA